MNISPISFGKHIPVTQCQIQNRKTHEFEPATIYEVDCSDESDAIEIENLGKHWEFSMAVANDMYRKHHLLKHFSQNNDSTFYVLKSKENKIIGIGELEETDIDTYDLKYLESKSHDKYKYVGQGILAAMAEDILRRNGEKFTVSNPVDDAYEYYSKECGFEDVYGYFLKMNRQQIIDYLDRTESKLGGPIINLKA